MNVNLAKPAAIAVVWRGMRVITQTDRHKHTQKKLARDATVQSKTQTHTVVVVVLMINRLRQCFHVVS